MEILNFPTPLALHNCLDHTPPYNSMLPESQLLLRRQLSLQVPLTSYFWLESTLGAQALHNLWNPRGRSTMILPTTHIELG